MSNAISPLIEAPAVQARLDLLYENLNPTEPTPLTAFLSSDINMRGMKLVQQGTSPGNGKLRKVQLIYTPRVLESAVSSTLTTDCSSANESAQSSAEYEIDPTQGVQWSESFNIVDLAKSLQENQDYVNSRILAGIDALRRTMETDLTSALALQVGLFAKSDKTADTSRTFKQVKTLYASDGKFNENALTEIYYSTRQANFIDKPYIFGTETIEKYFQALKAPASTQWGLNLEKYVESQYLFMPSYRIGDAFNLNNKERFVALDSNNFFILQYNRFEGMEGLNKATAGNALVQDTIVDPMTGIVYNYKWVYAPCGEKVSVFVSTAFQLASVPDDMYATSDRLNGVKGSLVFEIDN